MRRYSDGKPLRRRSCHWKDGWHRNRIRIGVRFRSLVRQGKERPLFASKRAVALLKPYWPDFQVPPIWTETVGSWLPSWGATSWDKSRRLPMVHNAHGVYESTVMETRH